MEHKLVTNINELLPLSDEIAAIASERQPEEHALYTKAHIKAAWNLAQTKGRKPMFVLSYENNSLVAVAPLQIFVMGPKTLYCKQLEFFNSQSNPLVYPHSRFLISLQTDLSTYLNSLKNYLNTTLSPHWDQFMLSGVHANEKALLSELLDSHDSAEIATAYSSDLSNGFESFFMTQMSSKSRTKVRKFAKSLKAIQKYEIKTYSTLDEEMLARLIEIHVQRQTLMRTNGRSERTSIFEQENTRIIFTEFVKDLAQQGMLQVDTLEINNQPEAFIISSKSHGGINAILMSFNTNLAKYSPLKILVLAILENAGNEGGISTLSYGQDSNTFKEQFGKTQKKRYKIRGSFKQQLPSKIKHALCKRMVALD